MLNSLVQSLWKTCVRILLSYNIGFIALCIIIFAYSFRTPCLLLLLVIMMIRFYKHIHIKTFILLGIIFSLSYVHSIKHETHIQSQVVIHNIETSLYQSTYYIKYQSKTFLFRATNNAYRIGDIIYLDASVMLFENKTRPFGIDFKHYYLSKGVYGTLQIHEINFVKHSFHINQIREFLIRLFDDFKSKEVFNAYLFDIETTIESDIQWLYLMRISGLHILVLLEILRHVFKRFLYHPVFPLVLAVIFFYLQSGNMSMLRLVIYYAMNTIFFMRHIVLSRQIKLYITWMIELFLFPNLIFHNGLIITFIIIIMIERISVIYQHQSWLFKSYLSAFIIQLILIPFNHLIYITQIIVSPLLMVIFLLGLYPIMLLTLFFPIFDHMLMLTYQFMTDILLNVNNISIDFVFKSMTPIHIVIIVLLIIWINQSKQKIQWLKRLLLIICILVMFQFRFPSQNIDMYVLDVGQGDAIIINSQDCTIVIDSFQYVKETLYGLGINHIDYLFITHKDIDHYKELDTLYQELSIGHVVTNPYTIFENIKQTHVLPRETIRCGLIKIDILGPLVDYKDDNDNSLILKVHLHNKKILFMGDASKKVEKDLIETYGNLLYVDLIKIGHHGSNTSTNEDFIQYIKAKHAIISVGRNNRYGMPHEIVINTLNVKGLNILRTDLMGTIQFKFNASKMTYSYYEP